MQVKSVWLEELFIIDNIKAQSRTAGNLFCLPDTFAKPAMHVNCRYISRTFCMFIVFEGDVSLVWPSTAKATVVPLFL